MSDDAHERERLRFIVGNRVALLVDGQIVPLSTLEGHAIVRAAELRIVDARKGIEGGRLDAEADARCRHDIAALRRILDFLAGVAPARERPNLERWREQHRQVLAGEMRRRLGEPRRARRHRIDPARRTPAPVTTAADDASTAGDCDWLAEAERRLAERTDDDTTSTDTTTPRAAVAR